MERFIGLDAHSSSCVFVVVGPSGKKLRTEIIEPNEKDLVQYVKNVPGRRYLCMEEGTLAEWLHGLLAPHVHRIVVTRPRKRQGNKTDVQDAYNLAEMIRVNDIQVSVYKPSGIFRNLREMARVYAKINKDVVRVQSRIKSLYRSKGVQVSGADVYSQDRREKWSGMLPPSCLSPMAVLYSQYDALVPIKEQTQKDMITEAGRHRIYTKRVPASRASPGFPLHSQPRRTGKYASAGRCRGARELLRDPGPARSTTQTNSILARDT
jgi:hypothetical protein